MGSGVVQLIRELEAVPTGLVHVGAHYGQEFEEYRDAKLGPVVYVEALPDTYDVLVKTIGTTTGHIAVNALCAAEDGKVVDFKISSNAGASSSMLDFGWCPEVHPEVTWVGNANLVTRRLDGILFDLRRDRPELAWDAVNVLVLDTQGTEMQVLAGAPDLLAQVDWVYSEVNEGGLYAGDCSMDDIQAFMKRQGFRLKHLSINKYRWGDALFARDRALSKP